MDIREATRELGTFAGSLRWEALPSSVRGRTLDVLIDTIGVTVAGARTPELQALQRAWGPETGPARPLGTTVRLGAASAAWLDGTAACCLELDEGNKFARGHPAAHAVPAALAVATERRVDGPALLGAIVAGHETAARFGAATTLRTGFHPHGHWGTPGAAVAAARLLGVEPELVPAAIDAAAGAPLATDFRAALDGSFVRNTWIGAANSNGITAARLVRAGLGTNDGRAAGTFGELLGSLDVERLVSGLGDSFAMTTGYFKRHASCSYTHPPVDAALELLASGVDVEAIETIEVASHGLAMPLARVEPRTRLAAMFSIPFVVAAAFRDGRFDTRSSDEEARRDPTIRRLALATTVVHDPELHARLPKERAARVTVRLRDGSERSVEVPNPIGDADHHPFGRAELLHKLDGLLRPGEAQRIADIVDALPVATDVRPLLDQLP